MSYGRPHRAIHEVLRVYTHEFSEFRADYFLPVFELSDLSRVWGLLNAVEENAQLGLISYNRQR